MSFFSSLLSTIEEIINEDEVNEADYSMYASHEGDDDDAGDRDAQREASRIPETRENGAVEEEVESVPVAEVEAPLTPCEREEPNQPEVEKLHLLNRSDSLAEADSLLLQKKEVRIEDGLNDYCKYRGD